ncbi:MAG TPA: DUF5335 family protein [Hyphomicrobiales bacterium]|nr:DUF5335 family protein [Hyphomicrobiales bacterium]
MQSATLAKTNWQDLLDKVSQRSTSQKIAIQINTPSIGAQTEAEQVQFRGITYDPKDDAVSIETDSLEHFVRHPSKVEFAYEGTGLICIEIVDGDGAAHLVNFTPPLSFPELERL